MVGINDNIAAADDVFLYLYRVFSIKVAGKSFRAESCEQDELAARCVVYSSSSDFGFWRCVASDLRINRNWLKEWYGYLFV